MIANAEPQFLFFYFGPLNFLSREWRNSPFVYLFEFRAIWKTRAVGSSNKLPQKELPSRGESFIYSLHFLPQKRSKYEDHLPIMSVRRGEREHRQRLSENGNHPLVLFTSARHAVHRLAAIEGRPIPGVSTVPRSKRSADEKKRMENIRTKRTVAIRIIFAKSPA